MTDTRIRVTKPVLPDLETYVECLKKIWLTRHITNEGEYVKSLEKELQHYLEVENLTSVSNGTLALHIAIKTLDLKGEVITTPFTFPATTNALIWEGLTPVFVDIDNETFNIDPLEIEKKITEKTSAILAVHTFGNPCYVKELQEIASKYDIKLIYDAAHAFGVHFEQKPVISFGDISTLSFHATKVYNTIEGGAIVCRDKNDLEKAKLLKDNGIKSKEVFVLPGTNAKMDEIRAAIGLCNLKTVEENINSRKNIYEYYKRELGEFVQFQKIIASKYNYSYLPICFDSEKSRNSAYLALDRRGIDSRKYFFPLTFESNYFGKKYTEISYYFKNAFNISRRILCLPIYPDLDLESVQKITEIVKSFQTT